MCADIISNYFLCCTHTAVTHGFIKQQMIPDVTGFLTG